MKDIDEAPMVSASTISIWGTLSASFSSVAVDDFGAVDRVGAQPDQIILGYEQGRCELGNHFPDTVRHNVDEGLLVHGVAPRPSAQCCGHLPSARATLVDAQC